MGDTSERRLYTTYYHRDIGINLLKDLRIHRHGIVRPLSSLAFRSIGIVRTQTLGGSIMIDHRVHSTGIDSEIQSRSTQLAKITQIIPPVRLRNHRHPVTVFLQPSGYDGSSE